jgi:hypothetical protein
MFAVHKAIISESDTEGKKLFDLIFKQQFAAKPANGLALPDSWAGRDNAILAKPTSSHANCLKYVQTPTRRLHVLLARF